MVSLGVATRVEVTPGRVGIVDMMQAG